MTFSSTTSGELSAEEIWRRYNVTSEDLNYFFNSVNITFLNQLGRGLTKPTNFSNPDYDWESSNLFSEDSENSSGVYCGSLYLHNLRGNSYRVIHGSVSLMVCLLGGIANILTVIVLSQKVMRTAINRLLCGLAVADLLVMLEYIPFTCHMYLSSRRPLEQFYSFPWAVFVLSHAHFTQVVHTVSIWLTVTLAIWRYRALKNQGPGPSARGTCRRRPTGRGKWASIARCHRAIVLAYVGSIIICIPSFLTFSIEPRLMQDPDAPSTSGRFLTLYTVNLSHLARSEHLHKVHLWAYGVFVKLGPCLVLTALTSWLLRQLWAAERHHARLKQHSELMALPSLGTSVRSPAISSFASTPVPPLPSPALAPEAPPATLVISPTNPPTLTGQPDLLPVEATLAPVSPSHPGSNITPVLKVHSSNAPTVIITKSEDQTASATTTVLPSSRLRSSRQRSHRPTDRTTRMLVAILVLFLTTEVPQGILALLSGVLGRAFFIHCYNGLGEILDFMALLNSAINFLLYCAMSRHFRSHFRRLFWPWYQAKGNNSANGANRGHLQLRNDGTVSPTTKATQL